MNRDKLCYCFAKRNMPLSSASKSNCSPDISSAVSNVSIYRSCSTNSTFSDTSSKLTIHGCTTSKNIEKSTCQHRVASSEILISPVMLVKPDTSSRSASICLSCSLSWKLYLVIASLSWSTGSLRSQKICRLAILFAVFDVFRTALPLFVTFYYSDLGQFNLGQSNLGRPMETCILHITIYYPQSAATQCWQIIHPHLPVLTMCQYMLAPVLPVFAPVSFLRV